MKSSVLEKVVLTIAGFAVASSVSLASPAVAKERNQTIANPGDFMMLSEVDKPSLMVFLSYSGRVTGKCGIKLRTATQWHIQADDIAKVLTIDEDHAANDVAKVQAGQLVAVMHNPEQHLFGTMFTISTRNGKPISEVLNSIDNLVKAEVIVEALPCDKVPVAPVK